MRPKTLALLCLALLLLLSAGLTAGCGNKGPSAEDKTKLSDALSAFDMSAGSISAALASQNGSGVAASIKAAKADMDAKWTAVIAAAKKTGWTAADSAKQAWSVTANAIDSLAADATAAQADAALSAPLEQLMAVDAELWTLAKSSK